MYFFYMDESGTRGPAKTEIGADGSLVDSDHIYVLLAAGLWEGRWSRLDRSVNNLKLELSDRLYRIQGTRLTLADCEVKSATLRNPKERQARSPQFLGKLPADDLTRLAELFMTQIREQNIVLFAVVVDKRKLRSFMTAELLHKKAYELLLERIEHCLAEYHDKHNGIIVMDDTQKQLNQALAMKHAYFQREGNRNLRFKHIIESPFFTDSRLSNGVQLADICAYNVYRAFRGQDFAYPWFSEMLPAFYHSARTAPDKLDGLKVFPDDSDLVGFAAEEYRKYLAQAEK